MKNRFAFLVIRVSLGLVFLMFGIGKLRGDIWAQTIRSMDFFLKLPWSVETSVMLIGALEILTGAALLLGLCTRFFAACAAAQLTGILVLLKFEEIRDIGLLGMALFIAMVPDNSFGIDLLRRRNRGGAR